MEDALRLAEEPEGGGPCLFLSMPSRYGSLRNCPESRRLCGGAVLPSTVGGLPSLLRDLACSITSIALCLLGLPGPRALSTASPEGWLFRGESLVSPRNAAISLVFSRLILRASRGTMDDEFDVDGRRAGTLLVRGGTLLVRGALARSMREGDTGVGRGCSYLRSIGTECASSSIAPLVLIGACGRGLSIDIALVL
jgi:hypothetical protein